MSVVNVSAVLFLFFPILCKSLDPNRAVDEALAIVAQSCSNRTSVGDIIIERKNVGWVFFPLDLKLTDNSLEDVTSITRTSDAIYEKLDRQARLEVKLSLKTFIAHYGHFAFKVPLLHASGSADLELHQNYFGLTAYIKEDCTKTDVYLWPPHGLAYASIKSGWWFSKPAQFLFYFLNHFVSGDFINNDLLLGPLNDALAGPLTSAIKKTFC